MAKDNILKRIGNVIKHTIDPSNFGRSVSVSGNEIRIGDLEEFIDFTGTKASLSNFLKAYRDNTLLANVVNKINHTTSHLKRVRVDDNGNKLENSKILDFLANPNTEQSQIEFYEKLGAYLIVTGNTFIHFIKGVGMGEEMVILGTDNVEINLNRRGDILSYKYVNPFGIESIIDKEDVLHIKYANITQNKHEKSKWGVSNLESSWLAIEAAQEKLRAEASIFKNRSAGGFISNESETPLLPKERERLQNELSINTAGSRNFGKLSIAAAKLKYISTGMSPSDLKLLESIDTSNRLIASAFGMPSVLFNDNANSTFNNVSEATKTAYNDVYIPLANKIDSKLSAFLSDKLNVTETITVDITSIEVLKASTNPVMQSLNSLDPKAASRAQEAMTINENRKLLGLDPLTSGGEELLGKGNPPKENENNI